MPRTPPLAALGVVFAAVVGVVLVAGAPPLADPGADSGPGTDPVANDTDFEQFESSAAFQQYVERGRELASYNGLFLGGGVEFATTGGDDAVVVEESADATAEVSASTTAGSTAGESGPRVSGTNVQEVGIDEPDVLKTDGEYAYYTPGSGRYLAEPAREKSQPGVDGTKVVGLQPPGSAEEVAELGHAGQLLRVGDTLVVFAPDAIYGYDVSDSADPDQVWRTDRESRVVTARLQNGTVYVVFASDLRESPCPVVPVGGEIVRCTDVYHPDRPVPVDVTYTAVAMDPETGEVTDSLSFVGSYRATVYMSKGGLHVTYTEGAQTSDVAMDFLLSDGRDLLGDDAVERLERLASYDLSDRAVMAEIDAILRDVRAGMDDREREQFHEDLSEAYAAWADDHRHEFTRTHVVKIGVEDGLDVAATGSVPGVPLNQFSLDEHDGHLRIATTVQPPRLWGPVNSTNDVYVLDGDLDVTGSVTGMGENERVYSVRFTGDTGYVVTFRRIDPFHVLDLSDPEDPTLAGELKLPGFSTYLHPLDDDRVLGIGEEDGKVKAVVFDVSDPTDPQVLDDARLGARWSAVSRSHHAFLLDREHGVFFLPASDGGHVFGYEDGLEEVYTVEVENPQRAMYLGDYLYVFAGHEVVVVDETAWEEVRRLELA